jgi:hypothetical protein
MPLEKEPKSQPVSLPEWSDLHLAMLGNEAYLRVSRAADQRAVSRVELYFATRCENWPLLSQLWDGLLASCPEEERPNEKDIAIWAEILAQTSMPIECSKTGQLLPTNAE